MFWEIIILALWLIGLLVFLSLSLVLAIGAPYVPTVRASRAQAVKLMGLKPGQTMYDLGSGDGAMLIAAAQAGLRAVGYEINPFLVLISRWRTRHYRKQVKIVWRSFWRADFSKADGVFVFLLDQFMARLDRRLTAAARQKPIRLVSHAFKVPSKQPAKTIGAMRLYLYPKG